ncbi:hypothetical protein TorRG33x02_060110, partial [Trema orientale]
KAYIYDDPIWPNPLPPPFVEAHYAHVLELVEVKHTCQILAYLAKLVGVQNQDPHDVLYDTYYEWKPLFDEPPSCTQLISKMQDIEKSPTKPS